MKPGERKDCEACGTPMIGALNPTSGRVSPIEYEPHDDGNVLLHRPLAAGGERIVCAWTLAGDTLGKARTARVELRRNHFQSCPEAARFHRD